jgi:uncharacterized ferredoxin-like protein
MSRGLGKIQARLLKILRAHATTSPRARVRGLDTIELADRVYHGFPAPRNQKLAEPKHEVAVRRALASLAKTGLVVRVGMRASRSHGIRRNHWRAGRWPKRP